MAVTAGRDDELSEAIEQLKGVTHQLGVAVHVGFGELIDDGLLVLRAAVDPWQTDGGRSIEIDARCLPGRGASMRTEASTEKPPWWSQLSMSVASSASRQSQRTRWRSTRLRMVSVSAASACSSSSVAW